LGLGTQVLLLAWGAAHRNICRKLIPADMKVQRTGIVVCNSGLIRKNCLFKGWWEMGKYDNNECPLLSGFLSKKKNFKR
jgi:hypothetical protein